MSSIANEIAGIKAQLDAVTASLKTLAAGILALVNEVNSTGDQLSPSTQAALDAVSAEASAVATAATADVGELSAPPPSA